MNSIQQCVWDAFRVEDIFEVRRGNAKDVTTRSLRGTMALVTAIDSNNAVSGMTTVLNGETIFEPSLTVHNNGNGVGLVFVHNYRFVATSDVTVLTLIEKAFNEYALKFFIPIIQKQRNKFNYGYKLANNRLKAQTIMLPAKNGKPDYAYMEAYMRNVEQILLKRHKDYLTSVMPSQEPERVSIDGKKWKAFFMNEVFDIKSSVRLTKDNMVIGNRPFVGASDSNNGVTAFVGNTNNSLDSNVLGVNYNGSVVHSFYHPYEAIFSDDVKRLHFKHYKDDKYAYLFVKQAILQQKSKFEYGYKFNGERMKRQQILLPITISGEPDYAFMSAYMKRLEYDIQRRYMKYIPSWA